MRTTLFFGIILCIGLLFARKQKDTRLINFAGVNWIVKNGGPYGPGPNYWSDSPQSVWLDDQGRLHLALRKQGDRWYCAEVYTTDFTTYGMHRFLVEGAIDRMDKNIVLGLFVYARDDAEIDVEYAKWGDENRKEVGSFTVQPYTTPGNQYTFESPLSDLKTTHFFDWQPEYVLFGSIQGHYYGAPPSNDDYIAQWVYHGADIPSDSDLLRTHINLWLLGGEAPQDLSVLEVIITDVVQPLSTSVTRGQEHLVRQFTLYQNTPNPFNNSTTIRYSISHELAGEPLELILFNAAGQKIKVLRKEKARSGVHSVQIKDDTLASGVYYYLLRIGKRHEIKKMVLVK